MTEQDTTTTANVDADAAAAIDDAQGAPGAQAPSGSDGAGGGEERVPYDRFAAANRKAKEAAQRATSLEQELRALRAEMEEQATRGLPEIERERKRAEQLAARAEEAERRAEESQQRLVLAERERWVAAAAAREGFVDPGDASLYVDLSAIEDADQAERAVKRVAKSKAHLVKSEDPTPRIGRVLEAGRDATPTEGRRRSAIDPEAEANQIAAALKSFSDNWITTT